MFNTVPTPPAQKRTMLGASLATLVLALAACSSSPSPSAAGGGASQPAASQAAASQAAASQAAASQAAASQAAAACAVTPSATSSATIEINSSNFGAAVTISAGQAVTFDNKDSTAHTITQGTNGTAVSGACVNEPIAAGATVIVTFNVAGDYDITCTIHPAMQTQVHVT